MKKLFSQMLASVVVLFATLTAQASTPATLESVVNKLKASVSYLEPAQVQGIMMTHYKTMRLVDENYQWVNPELLAISDQLLPPTTTSADAIALIDRMAEVVEQNPYMMDFFRQAEDGLFETLMAKLETEGPYILPAVVGYALVQENMTKAMYNDYNLIQVLMNIWIPTRQAYGIEANLDTFSKLKLLSIEKPMQDYIEFHTSGNIPWNYGKLDLPLNIFEATAEDLSADRRDNAKAGAVLAFNLPGELPARFADDMNGIYLTMPEPKAWADLYTIWNMAFVSHFEYFPFVMVKLMIPQVNDYANDPEIYIYNRSLALYTHLHFSFLGQFDQLVAGQPGMKWYDEELTKLFGKVSKKSALKYQVKVKKNNFLKK